MKRRVLIVLLVVGGLIAFFLIKTTHSASPITFKSFTDETGTTNATRVYYSSLRTDPFAGGKMWIRVFAQGKFHVYLYDLKTRKTLGELMGANEISMSPDGKQIFCYQREPGQGLSLLDRFLSLLNRLIPGKQGFAMQSKDAETFWILDMERNSARSIARVAEMAGVGSSVKVSPRGRFAYNSPTAAFGPNEIALYNITEGGFSRRTLEGEARGWWDDENIVFQTAHKELMLHNVTTRSNTVLLSFSQMAEYFEDVGITNSAGNVFAFFESHEGTNTFYLMDEPARSARAESYLVQVDRPEPMLKLLTKSFKFSPYMNWDATGTRCVYSGSDFGTNSDGVYLLDLHSGKTQTLVEPTDSKQLSLPGFYKDSVIYVRTNSIWQWDLKESKTTRLFPNP